jgi:NAD(P)-dependent dehydrogenase (short-subunit alcohol dehydrogenase family)
MPRAVSEQVVVIVGASSGIGRACALAFAARGAKVACAARSVQALDTLVKQITQAGGTGIAVSTDVADPPRFGRLRRRPRNSSGGSTPGSTRRRSAFGVESRTSPMRSSIG